MFSRPSRAGTDETALHGRPQLILAKWIVFAETAGVCFAPPLAFAVLFAALAWMGFFVRLYPYAHLIALIIFVMLFGHALGRARTMWKSPSPSTARRRVEAASGLAHRPLDVLDDRPVAVDDDSHDLWRLHAARTADLVKRLSWPRFTFDLAARDPYRLRYIVGALLVAGLIAGWGELGGRLIAAINPAVAKMQLAPPALDAWISPPDYTHLPPIMIATPAGDRYQDGVIDVPEGSTLRAHFAAKDGTAPTLSLNGGNTEFEAADGKDYALESKIERGDTLSIRFGWRKLGSWKIRVMPDMAPQIAFDETPGATERQDLRIAYDAKDDYGVTSVTLRIMPRESLPGLSADPIDVPLVTASDQKEMKRVDFADLTAQPWAGSMVDLQLVATDAVGHSAVSDKVAITLPERAFFQPVARALIEERKKLLQAPNDAQLRTEAANLMAGVAHEPASVNNDPLTSMALRAGAVRLVLDRDSNAVAAVQEIIWQSALRIEDGTMGLAERNLQQAQQELSEALDRNADEKEVQQLIDRLHQALAAYLMQLSAQAALQQPQNQDLGQLLGARTNMLTPQDLDRMLDQMRGLSASGNRDAARDELSKLQQIMEGLQSRKTQLSPEQQAAIAFLKNLRQLEKDQQATLDATFQKAQKNEPAQPLAATQGELLNRLHIMAGKNAHVAQLGEASDAMADAQQHLQNNQPEPAVERQNDALKALKDLDRALAKNIRESMLMISSGGKAKPDPFGRDSASMRDDGTVHVPDRFEADRAREILGEIQKRAGDTGRPKAEHEYIERLLQNF